MNIDCEKCGDKMMHWHCYRCRHFLTDVVAYCPNCRAQRPNTVDGRRVKS